jgi:hypothetical protein
VTVPADSELLARWAEWYPDAPPVGFLLREAYPERWLRIHSLPQGKRYPTSGFDYAELLRRHNAVAEDIFDVGQPCAIILVHTCKGRGIRAIGRAAGLTDTGLRRLPRLPIALSEEERGVFAAPTCIFGRQARWARGGFDQFITAVAEDRSDGVIVSLESGRSYAPYDGGADLFYLTEGERDRARDRFRSWTSARDDGL